MTSDDPGTAEELALLRATAKRFIAREVVPHMAEWRRAGIVDRALWHRAAQAGLLCASMPAEYGGAGGDFRHEAVIAEELSFAGFPDFGLPLHNAIIAPYILRYGSEEQKRRWLPGLASGALVGAIAMTEPGTGSDLQSIRTQARPAGNGYLLNGQKTFITNGQSANLIIVVCKTDPAGGARATSLLVVETEGAEGFRRGRNLEKIGLKANDTSELFFDDVPVPTANLLGPEPGQGFFQLMEQLPQERLLIAVGAVGAIDAAIAATIAYTKERTTFGVPVFDRQNTRFVLATAASEARIARVFVEHCTGELVAGRLDATTAAMAKWWTTERQCRIIDSCLQLFGGYGYMAEYPIAQMWADARVQMIYGGTNEIMKELIARSL